MPKTFCFRDTKDDKFAEIIEEIKEKKAEFNKEMGFPENEWTDSDIIKNALMISRDFWNSKLVKPEK